jgi:hypothetical protein
MPNTILLKKSSTAAAQPTAGQLSPGELAINTADGRLFAKNSANAVVNLPVSSISGQAITPSSVQTSGTADGVKIQAGGNANSRLITLQPTALGGNRTLTLPDATAELAMTFNPLAVTGTSPFANQKRGTIRNNFDDPTTEEAALFHGQLYNQLRFRSPALQEESADGGTTWTTSTRVSAATLGDMMRGEGEGTSVNIIPSGSATPLGYRLTWDDTVTGVVYWTFSHLYIFCSTNGNVTTFKVEAFHNTTGWTDIFTGTAGNYPGHVSIKHAIIPYYPTNAGAYGKLRITFMSSTPTTPVTMYGIEWFGGYPSGKRNAESYDRLKNVTFPAAISTPTGYRINNGGTSGHYLRGNGTQFVSSGIQAADVPTLNQSTTGSAATLTTGRTLWGQSFNGSANVSGNITTALNIEQTWGDYRVGTFFDNNYRMGWNYISGSRILNIFSTSTDSGGIISFSTRLGGGASATDYGTEKMRITSAGRVGIGTTAPATLLHTASTSELQNTLEYTTATAGFASKAKPLQLMLTTSGGAAVGAGVGLDFITKSNSVEYPGARIVTERTDTSNNHALLFLTGGGGAAGASSQPTEKVRITSDGRVGIGNTPQAGFSLDVQGAEVLRGGLSLSGSITEFSTSRFQLNAGTGSAAHSYACVGNGNFGVGISSPGSRLVVKGAGATSATSALNVTNSSDTSLLAVRDDGLTTVTGQISSTLAVGTAPLAVTSTTVCTNLNADTVDGQHASAFATSAHTHGSVTSDGKIGSTTGQVITTGAAGVLQASATLSAANLPAPQRLSSYCSGLFFG